MTAATESERITRDETRGSWALWVGVLTGPAAWTVQLLVDYALEEFVSCAPGSTTKGEILGMSIRTVALILNAVLLGATIGAGLIAVHCLRVVRSQADSVGSRAGWMAIAGVMNSVLFGVIIAAAFAPPLILEVCLT